jgi:Glycosyltransferase 61
MQIQKIKKYNFIKNKQISDIQSVLIDCDSEITICENLICTPLVNATTGYDFEGGLIDSKTLQLVQETILIRHNKLSQEMPPINCSPIQIDNLPKLTGTFFLGGVMFNNFGHFLLESIGRLWAYQSVRHLDPYIFFYTPWGIPEYKNKDSYVHQVFKGFNIPLNRFIFFKEVAVLEKVIIPKQKYGFGLCRHPDNQFVNFISSFKIYNSVFERNVVEKKIYVSRSQLPYNTGRPFGEKWFEEYLEHNGYKIIYPENYTLYQQLKMYTNATHIIFCDGGAIYTTIFLPHLTAQVAIVARRRDKRWNYKELTEHFYGYEKPVVWIDEVIGQYQYGLETWDAAAQIDWRKVSVQLKEQNFVTTIFEKMNTDTYSDTIKLELQQYIKSIQLNPLFLNYMEKLKEEYPVLPNSF